MLKFYLRYINYHALLLSMAIRSPVDSVTVHILVEGFRNNKGLCRLLVFETAKGFPDLPEHAKRMMSEKIHG